MDKYEVLKRLVGYNTIEDKENKKIIHYIESFLQRYDFVTEYKGKFLIMSIGENPVLGFLGHTDTVEYTNGWNSNPLELTDINDKLYGLGVCDMKGGIAAFLEAVSITNLSSLRNGIKVYFTYDEEISFSGIKDIIETNEKFPDLMIIGEPTNNEILTGSKGLLEYEFDFKGIKVHSSTPDKGKSANLNAVKFLAELNDFYEANIKPLQTNEFEVSYTTMNIGLINGGSAINSVSANCKVSIDFRIVNKEHISVIKEKINELAKKYDCNIKILSCVLPFINKVDLTKSIKTTNYITEASFINNVNRVILGAGPMTGHEVNEYITKESYDRLVKQYINIVESTCK